MLHLKLHSVGEAQSEAALNVAMQATLAFSGLTITPKRTNMKKTSNNKGKSHVHYHCTNCTKYRKRNGQVLEIRIFLETLLFWQVLADSAIERFLKQIYTLS